MNMLKDRNFIGALAFLAIGLISLYQIHGISLGTLSAPGPAFFPFYLSIIIVALSLILFLKSIRLKSIEKGELIVIGTRWMKLPLVIAGLVIYVYILKPLGYMVTTFLMLILLLKIVEEHTWKATLIISIPCIAISYIIFAKYLGIPLPRGIIPF